MTPDLTKAPAAGETINLSLVSHTNAGKTTLVRTLLGQDVGEVRDAAHVTDVATGYVLLQAGGDTLMLWDTPGFGDTARLLKRLKLSGNPLGWLLTQVWDRFRERPLWSSQQAVRNARDHADVILYLVNASEDPAEAGYVALELEILAWIGKPVLLLLNQMGPPRPDSEIEEGRWRRHLADSPVLAGALTLDAFARCWVQEGNLFAQVAASLPPERRPAMARLEATWRERNLDRFDRSMRVLAEHLAAAAVDSEAVAEGSWLDTVAAPLKVLQKREDRDAARAMARLAERLESGTRASTEQLIALHGLSGKAARDVLKRLEKDYANMGPAREGLAAVMGGLMSGAVTGIAADIAAGGLTLGGGMIVGGILGALGAGGLARGYNLVRGDSEPRVRWSDELFDSLVCSALLRYLAVAHFGRGRGQWEEGEHPLFWQEAVTEELATRREDLRRIWRTARVGEPAPMVPPLADLLGETGAALLTRFYPEAHDLFEGGPRRSGIEPRQSPALPSA